MSENSSPKKWWQRPILVMRRDYISQFDKFVNSDLTQKAADTRNLWGCNTEWVMGTLGCSPGLAHMTTFDGDALEKLPFMKDRDLLREYIPLAHKNGVKIIAYTNMHWFSYDFAKQHPGWEQLLSDGTPYGQKKPLYGNGTTMCVNTGWRKFAFHVIRETAKTGVDGIFMDGPVVFPGACHCATCQQLFQKKHGQSIPETEDWSNPVWKKFVTFREDSMVNFLRDARAALHEINPEAIIYLNSGKWRSSEAARSSLNLESYQDITGAEEFFHPGPKQHHTHATYLSAKFLSAGKNPAMVFTHHAMGAWHYLPLPPKEMQMAIAQSVAGGANPWFAFFFLTADNHQEEALEGVGDIQKFIAAHENAFIDNKSTAKVAVWLSEQNFRFYLSAEKEIYNEGGSGDEADLIADLAGKITVDWNARKRLCADRLDNEIKGITDILARDHVQYDVLWDNHVTTERLAYYQVLVLPNNACVSETQRQAIRGFVENGGTLIADFECGFYDETGSKSENSEWLNFLGIEKMNGCFAPSLMEDYVSFTAQSPLIDGFRPTQMAPRPELCLKITPLPNAETPAVIMNPVGMSYQELAGPSEFSAMHSISRGKGEIIYFSGLIGDFYFQRKMPAWERLMRNAINITDTRPFTITAPTSVICDMTISTDGNSYFLHLVNCSGDMQRPIQEFLPIHDIRVTVPELPDTATAKSLRQNSKLEISHDNGTASILVPRLEQYDVIQIDKK